MINGKFTTTDKPREQSQRKQKSKIRSDTYNLHPVKQSMFQGSGLKSRLDDSGASTKKFETTASLRQ